jgi:DNA gyrase subunit A
MNWVMGIAVWMATNIPPHNLTELLDALEFMIHHPNLDEVWIDELMNFIKWPDFPTGWVVYDNEAIRKAYATGRWSVIMRWVAEIEENKKWRKQIVITEIPYQVVKSALVEKIANLVKEKKIVWITDLRDVSNKDDIRIVIELKKDAFPKKILNQLYKLTNLQTSFWFNMIALWDRGMQPKLYNLKEILQEFITHRKEVITRRTAYELKVAEARAHILEWLKKALDHIDEIIKVIKASKNKDEARTSLMETFEFTEIQANAILDMQLSKLSGLERQKIEDELTEKLALIADLKDILAKPERVVAIISEEFAEIKDKFGDDRKTRVNPGKLGEFNPKDTIPNEEIFVVLSKNSYVKRVLANSFRTQRRGGKWITTATKENDEIKLMLSTKNHNDLLFFTSKWRVFSLPAYEIPETTRIAKGQPIINLLNLQKDEEIAAILDITEEKNKNLLFVTKAWTVKKLDMDLVKNIRSSWLIVLKVKEWDELSWVKTTSWEDNILIATKEGKAIQFSEDDVRPMWRAASWVRWIKLKPDDEVVQVTIVCEDDEYVFVVSENGMWKISSIDEYRSQKRWWSWVKVMAMTKKTGKLVWAMTLTVEGKKNGEIMLISRDGQTIRLPIKWIRATSRVTQWVILTKLKNDKDIIVSAGLVNQSEEEE